MSLRYRIERIVAGMPDDGRVSLSVSWLRRVLDEEPEAADPDALLTLEDVAERVGMAESTVRTWCNTGELEGFKLNGRAWRVRESALERYLEAQESPEREGKSVTGDHATDLGRWRRHYESEEGAA